MRNNRWLATCGTLLAVSATGFSSPAPAQGTIRIGAPLPITGPLSPEAAKLQAGMSLWVEAVNKAGGIKVGDRKLQVEVVPIDYQSNTPRAVEAAEKLIT